MATCPDSRVAEGFRGLQASVALCEQWLGLQRLQYPTPSVLYGIHLPPLSKGTRKAQGSGFSCHVPLLGSSPASTSGRSLRGLQDDFLVIRG